LRGGDWEDVVEMVATDEEREPLDLDFRLGLSSNSSKLLFRPLLSAFFARMSSAMPFLYRAFSHSAWQTTLLTHFVVSGSGAVFFNCGRNRGFKSCCDREGLD